MRIKSYPYAIVFLCAIFLFSWTTSVEGTSARLDNSNLIPPILDHSQTKMEGMSPDWVKTLIMAELRIETATEQGTFDSATSLLDHYSEMGVNALWIGPIYDRDPHGMENGYGNYGPHTVYSKLTGTDSVEKSYKVIKRFVDAAHKRNIRVIFDIVAWGVDKNAPILKERPEFWIRKEDGQLREAYNGYLFNWTRQDFREWFRNTAVRFIEETNADGFRVDLAPDTSLYYFKEVRDTLYERGRKIMVMSEMPSEPRDTFDLAQMGVNGWTEQAAYGKPEVLAEQKKRFGSMHDSSFMFRVNMVDAIKTGSGIGRPDLQQKGQGGIFRFYTAKHVCHDGYEPFVKGSRVRFGYIALSPFIPLWWIGEEWNNPFSLIHRHGVMYFNKIDWSAKTLPENLIFFEDVKRILRVRRMYPEIFEYFADSLRDANIAKVDSIFNGTPNPLQAYARYRNGRAVLVIPNYSDSNIEAMEIRPDYSALGIKTSGNIKITDLLTGSVLHNSAPASFTVAIPAQHLGIYLVE